MIEPPCLSTSTIAQPDFRIWLVEDNIGYSEAVSQALNRTEGLRCEAVFHNCEDALKALAQRQPPAVILLDIGLPGMTGLEGLEKIKAAAPQVHVVLLTSFDDTQRIFSALRSGASGYLLKSSSEAGILTAVREALGGGAPMSPSVAKSVLRFFQATPPANKDYGLTAREIRVLELMVKGLLKKQIAGELDISFHTVDTHLRSIYAKLHVNSRSNAVAKAVSERLVE